MKINLIFFLARFGFGGAGNSVFKLASSLNSRKFRISVICLGNCAYENLFKKKKIIVHKLSSKRLLFSFFQLKKIFNKLIEPKMKNIFISNINYTNIFCSIIVRKSINIKLIGIERTPLKELEIYFSSIDFLKKFVLKILLRIFYSNFDKIVCNSRYISEYLRLKYNYKSVTIHPPSINSKKIIFKKKLNTKSLNITTICRLSKEKRLQHIIFAINEVKEKNIILNIIGDGPEKKYLKEITKKLNLNNKVKFHGHQKKIFKLLSKSDLYINTSYFEGFPNSVVEAASMGIPIISSQSHGGINEILSNGKFGEIYHGGYFDLASKIKNYINDPQIFIRRAKLAKKNVLKFNLKNHKKKFENLFDKI
jgi:glycosyltransferase involved in cell wall biosynthesis